MKANNLLEVVVKSKEEMKKVGLLLGREIKQTMAERKKSLVICLKGELGSGKTTFVQGLAQGLEGKGKITSPTFVIMKKIPVSAGFLYHFDCYRLHGKKEAIELGFDEIISFPKNIVVIEWPEKIRSLLPAGVLWIKFVHLSEGQRKIEIGTKRLSRES